MTTKAHKFPKFVNHGKAYCFACYRDLDGSYWCDSGYPPGRGQYRQDCEECGYATWYDLEKSK